MKLYTSKNIQNFILVFYLITLSLMLVIRDIVGVDINKFIFAVVCIGFSFLLKKENLICSFCFLLPLLNGLPGNYILPFILVLLVIRSGISVTTLKIIVIFIVYVVIELIAAFNFSELEYNEYLGYFLALFAYLFLLADKSESNREKNLYLYVFGVLLFCIVVIVAGIINAPQNWMQLLAKGTFRFGDLLDGEGMRLRGNANELAYYCITAFAICLYLVKTFTAFKAVTVFTFLLSILIAILGAFSLSRSYVIVLGLVLVIFIFMQFRSVKAFVIAGIGLAVTAVIIAEVLKVNGALLSGFIDRFSRNDLATGHDRTTEFSDYNAVFFANVKFMLLGTGVVNYTQTAGLQMSTHNMLQQIYVCYGIPFGLFFLYLTIKPVIGNVRKGVRLESFIPAFAVLLFVQTIQFLNPYTLMLHYAVAAFALKTNRSKGSYNVY